MRWGILAAILLALILVPFVLFEEHFNVLAARLARGDTSKWIVAAGVVALLGSDVLLPIPSSLVSAAAGALLGFWRGTAATAIGMMVGCGIGYWVGQQSTGLARRFVGVEGQARAARLFARYGDFAVVLSRPVPVLAEASVIVAGLMGMPVGRFMHLTLWANVGVAMAYAAIGAFSMRADSFLLAFAGAMALPGLAALIARVWSKREGLR